MHRNSRNKNFKVCFSIIIIILLATGVYISANEFISFTKERLSENIRISSSELEEKDIFHHDKQENSYDYLLDEELYSPYLILVDLKDQKVVTNIRSEERIYPASLTKIMTTIVAIENIADLKETIILEKVIFPDLYKANASMAGFLPGEEVSAIDLLYGTMLPSGADASIGLANGISGSEKEFVNLMNEKAKELGMEDSKFENVTGLHNDNHYTTVKDIATLLDYSLKNETFLKIFTSERHSTASTNLNSNGITFYSTMSKKTDTYEFDGGKILGGKTGYTEEAGLCLATLAEKNGNEYILVTAGAKGNSYTEQYHITDAFTVYTNYLQK